MSKLADPTPRTDRNPSALFGASAKVRPRHLDRLAIVYIRQSSPHQVFENHESRERQYALSQFAQRLGWTPERVLVIDEDQGVSGKSSDNRPGFQRLLAEVSLDHAGLILGLELSRLSRSSKDWHHLVEVCAVFNTLLGDQDGLYDANDSNDRLILGMKGAMSEFELITLRNRLERGRDHKAERGQLVLSVPIGYLKLPTGEVVLEPDEEGRGVVQLVFDKFQELGSAWAVFRYLLEQNIQLGYRCQRGANRGQLEWRRPEPQRIMRILRHPIYAGAYAYGMHGSPNASGAEGGSSFLPPEEMRVLLQDQFPAYISWDQYLDNQNRLQSNRSTSATPGTVRQGEALLTGLVVCGQCGYRLDTHHRTRNRSYYSCESHAKEGRPKTCRGLGARELDELVTEQVLRALEPAAIDVSLRAAADIERERQRLHDHWRRQLEQARYEAERVERQYQAVEPENRRVARSLETRWEAALQKEQEIREDYERFLQSTPATLTEAERSRIATLAKNTASLWHAPETTAQDRKQIIRCLVEQVVVDVQSHEFVDVTIHWKGGFTSQHEIARAVARYDQMRDYDQFVERIQELHSQGHSVPAIAAQLNEEGFVPPRRRGEFSVHSLAPLMQRLGLVGERNQTDILQSEEWWVKDLARRLEIRPQKIYYWLKQGWVHSRRSPSGNHWIVWADSDELTRLEQLRSHRNSWTAKRVPELTVPRSRQAK